MYEVLLESAAERDLKRLERSLYEGIIARIAALRHIPRPAGAVKLQGSGNDWRIRVGAYRILYEIQDASRTVRVMRVRHRREVYR